MDFTLPSLHNHCQTHHNQWDSSGQCDEPDAGKKYIMLGKFALFSYNQLLSSKYFI